jgi:hypothetical protein
VKQNPKAKSFKKETSAYQKPTEKVDGETVTMVRYFNIFDQKHTLNFENLSIQIL